MGAGVLAARDFDAANTITMTTEAHIHRIVSSSTMRVGFLSEKAAPAGSYGAKTVNMNRPNCRFAIGQVKSVPAAACEAPRATQDGAIGVDDPPRDVYDRVAASMTARASNAVFISLYLPACYGACLVLLRFPCANSCLLAEIGAGWRSRLILRRDINSAIVSKSSALWKKTPRSGFQSPFRTKRW